MRKILLFVFAAFVLCTTVLYGIDPMNQYGLPCGIVVNKSDTTTYDPPLRMLFFSATAAQTITVQMAGTESTSTQLLFTYGAAGTYLLPVTVSKVMSTGTNVTGIVGLRECSGKPTHPSPTATPSATFTPTPTP